MLPDVQFSPLIDSAQNFRLQGNMRLERCPVCDSVLIGMVWQLPQTRLPKDTTLRSPGSPIDDTYLSYLPLLTVPQNIYRYDLCGNCQAIFRNPRSDDHASYRNDQSKVQSFQARGLDYYRGTADGIMRHLPVDAHVIVDAACGAGEVLALIKSAHPDARLLGIEISEPSVRFINETWNIPAIAADLDGDDLSVNVPEESVDFVIFNDSFQHVRSPLVVLRKLMRMLRVGGKLYFTAQHYGPNASLQIRVGEPIFINAATRDMIIRVLGAQPCDVREDIKMRVLLEKEIRI